MIKKENLIFLEASLKETRVVELVNRASEKIWHRLPDVTSFEHTCYINIGKELLRNKVKSIDGVVNHYIQRAEARHLKKTQYESPDLFSELSENKKDDEGSGKEFEVEDVLANVEEILKRKEEEKEMTALLAKGDRRKKLVITAWMNGQTNDLELSNTLASVLGGQAESHRKFIQRYRNGIKKTMPRVV